MKKIDIKKIVLGLVCSLLLTTSFAQAQEIDSSSLGEDIFFSIEPLTPGVTFERAPAAKKKNKNFSGTYQGRFALTKSKTFKASSCSAVDYNALFVIERKGKKYTAFPASGVNLKGKSKKGKSPKFKATSTSSGQKRKYSLRLSKVKPNSAQLKITELISSGKTKLCSFTHTGTFTRTK